MLAHHTRLVEFVHVIHTLTTCATGPGKMTLLLYRLVVQWRGDGTFAFTLVGKVRRGGQDNRWRLLERLAIVTLANCIHVDIDAISTGASFPECLFIVVKGSLLEELFLRLVRLCAQPLFNALILLFEMERNVVEALIPRLVSLLLQRANRLAEAAPMLYLAVLTNFAALEMRGHLCRRHFVCGCQVGFEEVNAIEVVPACFSSIVQNVHATVGFELEVL